MVLDLKNLVKKYNANLNGVIHVGGHYGEEHICYNEIGIKNQIWFEPQPEPFEIMRSKVKETENVILVNKALGNSTGKIKMNVDSYNQGSSSILKPKIHLQQYKHIKFEKEIVVELSTLDIEVVDKSKYNFLYMDCQGYELEILKGGQKTLENIQFVMSEINRGEVYENCAMVDDVDALLLKFGLVRVETDWCGNTWGDAFYVKK